MGVNVSSSSCCQCVCRLPARRQRRLPSTNGITSDGGGGGDGRGSIVSIIATPRRAAAAAAAAFSISSSNDPFSDDEKSLLRATWAFLRRSDDAGHRGCRVFLRIFELAPDARELFPSFGRELTAAQLAENIMFRSHASRFMTAVDVVLENLDSLDVAVTPMLFQLGRRHVGIVGFRIGFMTDFERAMAEVWRQDLGRRKFSGATRRAWKKLFSFLTSKVLDGYLSAVSDEKKKAATTATTTTKNGVTGSQRAMATSGRKICPIAN